MHPFAGSGSTKSWNRPDADFDEFVATVIGHRLGKYTQPGHPHHINHEDFKQLYWKSKRAIIDAERKVDTLTHQFFISPDQHGLVQLNVHVYELLSPDRLHNLADICGIKAEAYASKYVSQISS